MGLRRLLVCACLCSTVCSAAAAVAATETGVFSYPGYAEVVSVKKVTQQVRRSTPVKRCRWERLPDSIQRNYDPVQRHGEKRVTERRVKRCSTRQETRTTERITGYDVTLRYNGEIFTRHTQVHPGVRMPVTINITPTALAQSR